MYQLIEMCQPVSGAKTVTAPQCFRFSLHFSSFGIESRKHENESDNCHAINTF